MLLAFHRRAWFVVPAGVALLFAARQETLEWRELDARMYHLGDDAQPEWKEAPAEPRPGPLEIRFRSQANGEAEWLLELSARDVDNDWALDLNGTEFARLKRVNDELRVGRYPVPAGAVRAGENVLRVRAIDRPSDDLTVGRVRLLERSLRDVARLGRLSVRVIERLEGGAIPARLTLTDAVGNPLELYYSERSSTAVRAGVAYTTEGLTLLEVPEGECEVWASRGMEWSVARRRVTVAYGQTAEVDLALEREVDTTGWVAADTHIHTFTHSGHGDATVEERLVTLAGEGVELAIATDHNHQTDYRPLQTSMGLNAHFTPVVGNEVTTENGHMNAFPLDPTQPVPPYEEKDWKTLVAGIRAKGARVVILNHPRWPEDGKDPLTQFGFDERTGLNTAGQEFTFDAIELVNSDAPTSPPDAVLPAWFALFERGLRFTGVGSSDSHTVGVIVGQGRTYVPSASDDPAAIDVAAACRSFLEGRVTVSLGIFATLSVEGKGMGETLATEASEVEALIDARYPSWVTPRQIELIVNGQLAATLPLDATAAGATDEDGPTRRVRRVRLALPRPASWVVALVRGDKVTAPFWAMSLPEALAITNPVYVTGR
jgi:hypothetical protein